MNMNFNFKKPFIIAEIGGNHDGSLVYAKDLLIQAAEGGADAVKFQTYFPDKIVSKVEDPDRHKHFSKFSLSIDSYFELAELARKKSNVYVFIWDGITASFRWLDKYS